MNPDQPYPQWAAALDGCHSLWSDTYTPEPLGMCFLLELLELALTVGVELGPLVKGEGVDSGLEAGI